MNLTPRTALGWLVGAGLTAGLAMPVLGGPPNEPWPFWGRTATRVGNTATIGPRTPTIDWTVDYDPTGSDANVRSSCVLDRYGRLFQGRDFGITAVDTVNREVLWYASAPEIVSKAPAVVDGRVYWGWTSNGHFVCSDAATGETIWDLPTGAGFNMSAVLDSRGVVYFIDRSGLVYARMGATGEIVWTTRLNDLTFGSLTLVEGQHLLAFEDTDARRLNPLTGTLDWSFHTLSELSGYAPFRDDRFYIGSADDTLYCVDAATGEETWRFFADHIIDGQIALGRDDGIYFGTKGGDSVARLFSLTGSGEKNWRIDPDGSIVAPPLVDGNGTIYFGSTNSSPRQGWANGVRLDGTMIWSIQLPDMVYASPMLGPDGTLYVTCRNDYIYAFRDPHVRATITNLQTTTGEILDGGIEELGEVDDSYLHTRSGFGNRLTDLHKMELVISARVSDPQPEIMRIQIKSKIDHPSGTARVSLRNWQTGDLEIIREYAIGLDDPFEWIQIPEGGNAPRVDPARYIGPGGAIELQLKHTVFVPFLAFTFESFIDQIKIEVTG